jgi:hypothetical protein
MRPMWGRLIKRTAFVGVALAVIGYILARAFLMVHRINAGGAYDAANERVLWQTPLVMALLGMALSGGLEFVVGVCRRPAPVQVASDPNLN